MPVKGSNASIDSAEFDEFYAIRNKNNYDRWWKSIQQNAREIVMFGDWNDVMTANHYETYEEAAEVRDKYAKGQDGVVCKVKTKMVISITVDKRENDG